MRDKKTGWCMDPLQKQVVKVILGTNKENGFGLMHGKYNDLQWWSDNMETLAHYYEGCAIEMIIELDPKYEMTYIANLEEVKYLKIGIEEYTYGFAEVLYPKGAIWYSFSGNYIETHAIDIKEIFPDLSRYKEE